MRIFAECLLFAFCFKQHQDDEQTFADQLEQQASSQGIAVIQIEQPEPEEHMHPELKMQLELELDRELTKGTLRKENREQTNSTAVIMRGSHSPARLEEISICADVHPSKLTVDIPRHESMAKNVANERYSGVTIKDEIEIFTDVELGNGAHYFIF
ncbi:uncharacterized protein LOC117794217 [Drosophila innubila]|uniref:uncharacterized protein LOC117794217 n=1 Tax=Drosophila innubila TaxID=198719 RepID=UPI00148CD3BB|nr:uncharacterized protein LOC117794217 [Drosophila innubila]